MDRKITQKTFRRKLRNKTSDERKYIDHTFLTQFKRCNEKLQRKTLDFLSKVPIDYAQVEVKLEPLILKSKKFLLDNLK